MAKTHRALTLAVILALISIITLIPQSPRPVNAQTEPNLFVFSEDYDSASIIDPSLVPCCPQTAFNMSIEASTLPPIVDQSNGGLQGFDLSLTYNSSIILADRMSFTSPLCPSSDGCIFDFPSNDTLIYNNTMTTTGHIRLALVGLGPNYRATTPIIFGVPTILFRIEFQVIGKGATGINIDPSSQLIGYNSSSCNLVSYTTRNGLFDNRPDFTASANPSSLTLLPGQIKSTTVSVTATRPPVDATLILSNFTSPIIGSYSFNPRTQTLNSAYPSFTSVLTINVTAATPLGVYALQILASPPNDPSGFFTYRLNFTLTVGPGPVITAYNSPKVQSAQLPQGSALLSSMPTVPLLATFKHTASPVQNSPVSFTATVWCGTPPYTYTWSFGDGTTSTNSTSTHTYTRTGTFNVILTIQDNTGQTYKTNRLLTVTAPPPPPQSPPLNPVFLATAIALVILLLAAGFFLVRRNRTRRPRKQS